MNPYLTKTLFICLLVISLFGCPTSLTLPESKITMRVIDEDGKPLEGAKASVSFEVFGGNNIKTIVGITDKNGFYSASHKSTDILGFGVEKAGYYESKGGQHFTSSFMGKWQPWNPEVKIVLRRIIKPISMYARNTKMSKMDIPEANKAIGFDLIEYDWVAPYGHGKHPDFIFKLERNYKNDNDFDCKMQLTFPNRYDGIQEVSNIYEHSIFKLSRYAPITGYNNKIVHRRTYNENTFNDGKYYFFRVRSIVGNGRLIKAMYGKIHGDIRFEPRGSKTASIIFKYYLNPDYTDNLEFDPKQNLFKGTDIYERLQRP